MSKSKLRAKRPSIKGARNRSFTLRNICIQMDEFVADMTQFYGWTTAMFEWHDEWVRWLQLPWYKRIFTPKPVPQRREQHEDE